MTDDASSTLASLGAASLAAAGAAMHAAPDDGAGDADPPAARDDGGGAHGSTRAALACHVLPALAAPLISRLILIVVSLVHGAAPAVLLPSSGGLFGSHVPPSWRGTGALQAVSETASRWVPPLLALSASNSPPALYAAVRRPSPHVSDFLAIAIVAHRYDANQSCAANEGGTWYELSQLRGQPEYIPAAVAAYRALSHVGSISTVGGGPDGLAVADLETADAALGPHGEYSVGALAAAPPAPGLSWGFAREQRTIDEMYDVHVSEVAQLRATFACPGPTLAPSVAAALRAPLLVGFGPNASSAPPVSPAAAVPDDTSDEALAASVARFEAIWAEDCKLWAGRIQVDDFSALPDALRREGALASFTDEALALVPPNTRCVPPCTARAPAPEPQAEGAPDGPRSEEGFFPPGHFCSKAGPWKVGMLARLADIAANGENATAPSPGTVIFGQSEFLPKFRGWLYSWCEALGRYVPTHTEAKPDTHLNRSFAHLFAVGYPDQEMVSTLDS